MQKADEYWSKIVPMTSEKHEFQKAGEKGSQAMIHLLRGFVISTFGTLWHAIQTMSSDLLKSKNKYERMGVLIAILIIALITLNAVTDLYRIGERFIHKSWYEQQFLAVAEQEAHEFFKLYSQKFEERDCDFMREVAADEAMYDKYGHERYEDYDCNNYYTGIKAKYFLPFEIEAAIDSKDKRRIRGKAVVLRVLEDGRHSVGAQHFEIWKKHDWELWHFNASSREGSPKIPLSLVDQR